jgi:hypothetical protein
METLEEGARQGGRLPGILIVPGFLQALQLVTGWLVAELVFGGLGPRAARVTLR